MGSSQCVQSIPNSLHMRVRGELPSWTLMGTYVPDRGGNLGHAANCDLKTGRSATQGRCTVPPRTPLSTSSLELLLSPASAVVYTELSHLVFVRVGLKDILAFSTIFS